MAIGTQFSALVIDLRAELRRSSDVSVGVDDQDSLKKLERFLGRAIPRVMLPDFDYGMQPSEIKQLVSYDEERTPVRHAGGVAATAQRIASVPRNSTMARGPSVPRSVPIPRPVVNGSTLATAGARKPGSAPAKNVATKSVATKSDKSGARGKSVARAKKALRSAKPHKPGNAKGRK